MVTIARGRVAHRRHRPVKHGFAYPVFFLRIPLSQLARVAELGLPLDRFGLVSFHRADHGPRDGGDLEAWARHVLARHGMTHADGEIVLQAFPRILGYVFNPIATWWCHDRTGALRAVICEVSNTFGERHVYVVRHADGRVIGRRDRICVAKAFHVSPFFEVTGHYTFRFACDHGRPRLFIDYHDTDGLLLSTALCGEELPLTRPRLWRTVAAFPLLTLLVTARIHWQALRLWWRRVPWHPKPSPSSLEETTP